MTVMYTVIMKWKQPPIIKIYEALGAVADGRVHVEGNTAKVFSSSGNKAYNVTYDPEQHAIMANDNGSYWKGYLGYPSIAFLMQTGTLSYSETCSNLLKGIAWKDINVQYKNDFDKTLEHILSPMAESDREQLETYVVTVEQEIIKLDLEPLGKKTLPPEGY